MEDGEALVHVLVHDHTAAGVEIAHARSYIVVRGDDVDIVDRLEDLRAGVAEGLLEGVTTSDDEGDFLGVYRVHLTVIYIYADVACVGTGKRAFLHLGLDTLKDSRHEGKIDRTTDNAVVEFEFAAPIEVDDFLALEVEDSVLAVNLEVPGSLFTLNVRANEEVDLTELTGTTGLFLVTILCGSNLCDGLTVRNLRSKELYIEFELVVDSPLDIVD